LIHQANINGINNTKRRNELHLHILENKPDIILVQDIRL